MCYLCARYKCHAQRFHSGPPCRTPQHTARQAVARHADPVIRYASQTCRACQTNPCTEEDSQKPAPARVHYDTYIYISLSLSLYIYIYICISQPGLFHVPTHQSPMCLRSKPMLLAGTRSGKSRTAFLAGQAFNMQHPAACSSRSRSIESPSCRC